MDQKTKDYIDSLSYVDLLRHWRFDSPGSPLFCGETGVYFAQRMNDLRREDLDIHPRASKLIGWEQYGKDPS